MNLTQVLMRRTPSELRRSAVHSVLSFSETLFIRYNLVSSCLYIFYVLEDKTNSGNLRLLRIFHIFLDVAEKHL